MLANCWLAMCVLVGCSFTLVLVCCYCTVAVDYSYIPADCKLAGCKSAGCKSAGFELAGYNCNYFGSAEVCCSLVV